MLLLAVVVAFNLGRGRTPLGAVPDGARRRVRARHAARLGRRPITGLTADGPRPAGRPARGEPRAGPLAVDGDPATAWRTMTYDQNFGPGGLKTGVGLIIDLGAVHDVASVDLTLRRGADRRLALRHRPRRPPPWPA